MREQREGADKEECVPLKNKYYQLSLSVVCNVICRNTSQIMKLQVKWKTKLKSQK